MPTKIVIHKNIRVYGNSKAMKQCVHSITGM